MTHQHQHQYRHRFIVITTVALMLGMFSTSVTAYDKLGSRVTPATTGGPNFTAYPTVPEAQPYFILNNVQPGDVISSSIHVTNVGDTAGPVRLFPVDATTGQTSGIVYFNEANARTDVGSWIAISGTAVTLNPSQSVDIPFTIIVPPFPRSGQHLGGLVLVGAPPPGGQVTIVSQFIVSVLVNLPPPLTESFTITGLALGGTQSAPGLLVGLRNNGNILQKPSINVVVKNAAGQTVLNVPTFTLDTFVPQTQINYPLAIAPGALLPGDYFVTVSEMYGSGTPQTMVVATYPIAYYYVPTLTGISPLSGITAGGTTVTLSGFGFGTTADTQVLVNGVALPGASVLSVAARSIRFTAPAHGNGTVTITVRVAVTVASGSMTYTYGPIYSQPIVPHPTVAPPVGAPPPNAVPIAPHPVVTPVPGAATPNYQPGRH